MGARPWRIMLKSLCIMLLNAFILLIQSHFCQALVVTQLTMTTRAIMRYAHVSTTVCFDLYEMGSPSPHKQACLGFGDEGFATST